MREREREVLVVGVTPFCNKPAHCNKAVMLRCVGINYFAWCCGASKHEQAADREDGAPTQAAALPVDAQQAAHSLLL